MQVLYMGKAPRTKETLPDFHEKCRVTRHSRVFRWLTGSQRTLGFGASHLPKPCMRKISFSKQNCCSLKYTTERVGKKMGLPS